MNPLFLMRALGWLRSAWSALMGLVIRYPWQCACAGLLLACAWLWHGKMDAISGRMADRAAYIKAQTDAKALADARTAKLESNLAQFSGVTNHDYEDGLADGRNQLATYFDGRLRVNAKGSTGGTISPSKDNPASISGTSAPPATVAFTQEQLDGWETDYQYGLKCREFARGIADRFNGKP